MISQKWIPHIVFNVETRNFFSPKKLWIAHKLTFQNGEPLDSVNILIGYIKCVCKFHCRDDNAIKNNEVISWNS